jgi:KaiC/GvpD/RAD55 family RecA-like ATPase
MPSQKDSERTPFGVPGMDELVFGGLLKGTLTLLTGTTGTGKTILGAQFLYNGALKYGQPGVYVSFEESPDNIKHNMKKLGIDFEPLEKKKMIAFARYDPYHLEDVYELIESAVKKVGAQRVVIDSVAALGLYIRDPAELRRTIFNIALLLRKLGCTSIITSEILPAQRSLSRFGVEEFVSDSIVVLYYLRSEAEFLRSVTVWKMRGSEHSQKLHPYKITDKGIVIYPKEVALARFE